ncbi:MAG TPA: glycosyltransferase family 4 protein [Candidatus Methylacidiphilales bacterium]|nr:glycosyltransferase family 4 protein [Candidatus Methylacidiphilales bacterium]
MKLLYLFPEEFSGRFAREYHVYRLADSLAAAGCDVTLAAAPSPGLAHAEQLHDLFGGSRSGRVNVVWLKRRVSLGPWNIRSGAWFYRQLDRLIPSLKPDLAFTMHLKAADHLGKRHPSLPLVFEAHEIFADSYPETSARHRSLLDMERRIYGRVRGVVAISTHLAESLQNRFAPRVPLRVQHDGIDETMLLDATEPPDAHELIYTGSLQPWKGVPVAVEAMRLLPEFHLTVLGGEGKPLDLLLQNAPCNVTCLGRKPREELLPFMQRAGIGLMPNLLEPRSALYTFPLKLLEYSAAGNGIVASRIPVFDRIDLGGWVETVPSGSPEALAAGVRALTQRGVDRGAARAWARQFLWKDQGVAMKQFLESLIK